MKNLTNITTTGQTFVNFLIAEFGKGNIGRFELQEGLSRFELLKSNKERLFTMRKLDTPEYISGKCKYTRILTTPIASIYVHNVF